MTYKELMVVLKKQDKKTLNQKVSIRVNGAHRLLTGIDLCSATKGHPLFAEGVFWIEVNS